MKFNGIRQINAERQIFPLSHTACHLKDILTFATQIEIG